MANLPKTANHQENLRLRLIMLNRKGIRVRFSAAAMMKCVLHVVVVMLLTCRMTAQVDAVDAIPSAVNGGSSQKPGAAEHVRAPANVLTAAEWRQVDAAVSRALSWLAAQRQSDGSFPT